MKILMKKPVVGFKGDEKGNTSIVSKDYSSEKSSTEIFKPSSSSNLADMSTNSKVNELESTRAEMVEVKEENQRLKSLLAKIMDDYQKLQSQLTSSTQEGESKKSGVETSSTTTVPDDQETTKEEEEGEGEGLQEDDDLVSLSLGTSSSGQRKLGEKNKGDRRSDHKTMKDNDDDVNMNTGLRLGFDCRLERSNSSVAEDQHRRISSQDNGYEDQKEEVSGHQPWQPSKILKVEDQMLCADEVSQHMHIKKARVSVRARCDGPTMNDGCQWRKYGQKISKGNPCPRAYYRCTVAPSCPVRKQVQRCADDMSVLITTYEGTHDHPLPMAATAMASTTSAAANMIISGSSSSSATHPFITTPTSIMAPISPLNFRSYPNPIQSNLSTITLDLTSPSSNPSPPKPNIFSSSQPRFLFSNSSLDPISPPPPSPWGVNGYLGFGSNQSYNNNRIPNFSQQQSSLFLQKQSSVDQIQRSTTSGGNLTDNIAKAITTDPSFQSALATAINSFVSNRKDGGGNDHQSLGQNLKWGSSVNNLSSGGGFLDKIGGGGGGGSDSNLQKGGSMIFHQNGFSGGKMISSALPVEKKEQRS